MSCNYAVSKLCQMFRHKLIALFLLSLVLLSCGRKPADTASTGKESVFDADTLSEENTEAVDNSSGMLPSMSSDQLHVVPTMRTSFQDLNTVQCSNIEYLWNELMQHSDKDISSNPLAKEFARSQTWKKSMDTSKLVLAFGKPGDVLKSVVRQYKSKYGIDKNDLVPVVTHSGDTRTSK
ncbi:MAG: hypothetical protein QM762_18485 [Chryseolinea sp.]